MYFLRILTSDLKTAFLKNTFQWLLSWIMVVGGKGYDMMLIIFAPNEKKM